MKWVKASTNNVAFRSGTDNEPAPSKLLFCFEDLAEVYEDFKDNKMAKKKV